MTVGNSLRNLFARPSPAAIPMETASADLEVSQIRADPEQPRKQFDAAELADLGQSLMQRQQQPIRVRHDHTVPSQPWVIIDGECRWRAAQLAGKTTLQAVCVRETMSPGEILREQLVANLHRIELKPIEQAQAFHRLMGLQGFQESRELALYLNLSQARISKALALLTTAPAVQQAVAAGTIAASSGYELSRAPAEIQAVLAQKAAEGGWNRERVKEAVAEAKASVSPPTPEPPPPLVLHAVDVGLPELPDQELAETVFPFTADDAEITVRFPRRAEAAEALAALELVVEQARTPVRLAIA